MELDEFIKTTLVCIAKGMRDANNDTKQFRQAAINESPLFQIHRGIKGDEGGKVHFDVAVTVNEESSDKAGGGIRVAGIGLGGEKASGVATGHESRIKFQVDVAQIVF